MAARRLCQVFVERKSDGSRHHLLKPTTTNFAGGLRVAQGAVEALRVAFNGDRYQDVLSVVVAEVVPSGSQYELETLWRDGRYRRAGDVDSNTHTDPSATPATGGAP